MLITSRQSTAPVARSQSKPAEQPGGDCFDFKQDCIDQATWLTQQCRARFGCTPDQLMKGPDGFERFSQLAAEWRTAHPRD